jgi:hypothetical protein
MRGSISSSAISVEDSHYVDFIFVESGKWIFTFKAVQECN